MSIDYETLVSRLSYDKETGIFTWKTNFHASKIGKVAGTRDPEGYLAIRIGRKAYRSHRLAWLYMTGAMPSQCIDHINGDRSDNRFANLREASTSLNAQNRRGPRNGQRSGYLGVTLSKGKWVARIFTDGRRIHLGRFASEHEAGAAYALAKSKFHAGAIA